MFIHYYIVHCATEAFSAASRDTRRWDDIERAALTDMAKEFRRGFRPSEQIGTGWMCHCALGDFSLFVDAQKGYGIAIVRLCGYEFGNAEDVAKEWQDFGMPFEAPVRSAVALPRIKPITSSSRDTVIVSRRPEPSPRRPRRRQLLCPY